MSDLYIDRVVDTAMLPERKTKYSAGLDLATCFDHVSVVKIFDERNEPYVTAVNVDLGEKTIVIPPQHNALVPTGLKMSVDAGYFIAIYPRSGLSVKEKLTLINCIGVIDADYMDEVMITLFNASAVPLVVSNYQRVAQMMVQKCEPISEIIYGPLKQKDSERSGGFGSTGK